MKKFYLFFAGAMLATMPAVAQGSAVRVDDTVGDAGHPACFHAAHHAVAGAADADDLHVDDL